jgi:hypothetical protein
MKSIEACEGGFRRSGPAVGTGVTASYVCTKDFWMCGPADRTETNSREISTGRYSSQRAV